MSTPPPYLLEGLRDLADTAPLAAPDPGLWDVARRYHRRRRTGSLGIALVMVLAALGILGLGWQRAGDGPQPAAPGAAPALPTRLVTPSPWLLGTDDEGALGPLAVVMTAERGSWTGTERSDVAVSALTGEYRFLDLPDRADITEVVALAPDGRHLAYWYTGPTTGVPNQPAGPVAGVAVYDTSTGEVQRLPVPTAHGLAPQELVWADPERLVLGYGQWLSGRPDSRIGGVSRNTEGLLVWQPSSEQGVDTVLDARSYSMVQASNGDGILLVDLDRSEAVVRLDGPQTLTEFNGLADGLQVNSTAIDASGTRLAGPWGNRNPNDVRIARVRGGRLVDRSVVPGSARTFRVNAWLDDDHIAITGRFGAGYDRAALSRVDVRTGESTLMTRFPVGTYGGDAQFATGLLATPTVERPDPPRPIDPRLLTGLSVGVVLAGLGALLAWRRRVRP